MSIRSRVLVIATCAAVLMGVSPASAAPSAYNPETTQTCQAAAAANASPALFGEENRAAAWTAFAATLQGLVQPTTDADLAAALDGLANAATGVATTMQADNGIDPDFMPYNNALETLFTACMQLAVTDQSLNVKKFKKFTYQTGQVVGIQPIPAKYASMAVSAMVAKPVAFAKKANKGSCLGSAKMCGYFVQTLTQDPCADGMLCVRQQWGLLAVGANSVQDVVNTLALGATTGTPVPLSTFVPAASQKQFLASLNAAVTAELKKAGLGKDPFWKPHLTMKDVRSWLPEPDGMHVWFDKYAVGPGVMGVVNVVVPLPSA